MTFLLLFSVLDVNLLVRMSSLLTAALPNFCLAVYEMMFVENDLDRAELETC